MTWLALHFPDLPLELYSRSVPESGPLAVTVKGRERRILLCNAPAAQRGVAPGQAVAAALVLAGELRLLPHRPEAEQAALERAALWAGRFSSRVSLAPPRSLLLEAGCSLALFGGVRGLMEQVQGALAELGYRTLCCLGPTPEAALLLARRGGGGILADAAAVRATLGRLPLSALELDARQLETLLAMGLRTLGDLLRLPRAGLAGRCGAELVRYLERLLGEVPDPRSSWEPPDRFSARLELPAEVSDARALLFAARRLLVELCGFLLGRGGGAQRLQWTLLHAEGRSSRLLLGLARPGRDPEQLSELLRERLERFELAAPVREIALVVEEVQPLQPENLELFPDAGRRRAEAGERLLERLQARLGTDAVTGLGLVADHRPERAWRYTPPGEGTSLTGQRRRPLWLLPEPRPLEQRDGWPRHRGERLDLGRERERIEAGWWDGGEVGRDYFVARSAQGGRLWVFRELSGRRRWFLHGWFV